MHQAMAQLAYADAALDRLRSLQFGDGERKLLFTQDPTGFGSQVARRILGLRLALITGRQVVFPSFADPPYQQIFEPIHGSANYLELKASALLENCDIFGTSDIVYLDFWRFWDDRQLKARVYGYVPSELAPDTSQHYVDGMLLSQCRLLARRQADVLEATMSVGLTPETLGVHVRRGDKAAETPFVPIWKINEVIASHWATGNFKNIFVASDSLAAIEAIEIPNGATLIYNKNEKRYNNANHRFVGRNQELSEEETRTACNNVFMLASCKKIIGQSNAQFSRLAAASIVYRNQNDDFGTLIPGDFSLRSPAIRALQSAKQFARRVTKAAMPKLTIRGIR